MVHSLLSLIAVALLTMVIPFVSAIATGDPINELLRFPLHSRGFDPVAPAGVFTSSAYALAFLGAMVLIGLCWPRRPSPGPTDRAAGAARWPRFVWLSPLVVLAALIAIDGRAGNAAVGLLTLALILLVNADTERRTGSSLISQRRRYFLLLFPISLVSGWLFFYWLNLFAALWTYPQAQEAVPFALGKSLDYATLLPALLSLRQWLASFPPLLAATNRGRCIAGMEPIAKDEGWLLIGLAGIGLVAYGIWSNSVYWLMLVAPVLLAVGIQTLRGQPTSLVGIERGDWSRPLLSALAVLLIMAFSQAANLLLGEVWSYALPMLGGPTLLGIPVPVWLLAPLPLALLGLWLADQLAAPFRQHPQQPPFRPRSPIRIPVVDLSRFKNRP